MIEDAEVMTLWKAGRKPPAGLRPALIEYPGAPEPAEYYAIRIYRTTYDAMTKFEQFSAIAWLQDKLQDMNEFVPISMEVWRTEGSKL